MQNTILKYLHLFLQMALFLKAKNYVVLSALALIEHKFRNEDMPQCLHSFDA